ncbi:MAG TPA: hypothetical protein VE569_03510 [Acidimicrobiia bacterium]|nr:hypothetical protein [Acidimicrobiia bacterium]
MKAWALFMYGVSAGMAVAWGLAILDSGDAVSGLWYAMIAAVALAAGLILHQRSAALARGRRWRRTRQ